MSVKLRAGVLIVGSLLWDNAGREEWRRQRLDMRAASRVLLPIRYGRLSAQHRNYTYTIVLSKLCYRHRELGVGYVAPCQMPIGNADDLMQETRELAAAEGLKRWTWGAVGVLTNPNSEIPMKILATWRRYAAGQLVQCDLFAKHSKSERPVISKEGVLQLRWPHLAESDSPAEFDLLFATPTALNEVGPYPTEREIGETCARQDKPDYFIQNVRHGIRTARDSKIWKNSLRLRPDWAARYPDVGIAVGLPPLKR